MFDQIAQLQISETILFICGHLHYSTMADTSYFVTDYKVTICTKGPLFHTVTCTLKDKKATMQIKKQEDVFRGNRMTYLLLGEVGSL